MDNVEKSRIRLTHWIDHNLDHLRGYSEVASVLETEGLESAAKRIREGIRLIEEANSEFSKALADVARTAGKSAHDHGHDHSHGHGHTHGTEK